MTRDAFDFQSFLVQPISNNLKCKFQGSQKSKTVPVKKKNGKNANKCKNINFDFQTFLVQPISNNLMQISRFWQIQNSWEEKCKVFLVGWYAETNFPTICIFKIKCGIKLDFCRLAKIIYKLALIYRYLQLLFIQTYIQKARILGSEQGTH